MQITRIAINPSCGPLAIHALLCQTRCFSGFVAFMTRLSPAGIFLVREREDSGPHEREERALCWR
jgi:hypothetical protein